MLDSIRRLMAGSNQAATSKDAFDTLNSVAPLKSAGGNTDKAPDNNSFICREAVLDRQQRIAGYEFSLERELQSRLLEKSTRVRQMQDDAMLRNLAPLGVSTLLGERFAFIRLSPVSLKNPLLRKLSSKNTVIMINTATITSQDMPQLREGLQYLDEIGVNYGWTLRNACPEIVDLLSTAAFVEIEATAFDGIQLKTMCTDLREANSRQRFIASRLETLDDFNLCFNSGFHYFSGSFVTRRENWHAPKSEVNRLRVFEALNMLRSGAEIDAVSKCLITDPILTFKLLRYINSPGMGLQHQVNDIHKALMVLGRDRFYRWLSLLVFDFKQPGYKENVLKEQALSRARLMELLSGKGSITASADHLFITGLFSLLDVLIGMPLAEVLKQIALPAEVVGALNGEEGMIRDVLALVVAVESNNSEEANRLAAQFNLDAQQVTELLVEALAWAQKIFSAGEQ